MSLRDHIPVVDRFVAFGIRTFTPVHTAGRVPFQPLLYFFLWAAAIRITFNDKTVADIPFREALAGWAETMWDVLAIGCPPLALLGWWLIAHRRARIKLAGHWLRLSADFGMLIALLTYHVATAGRYGFKDDEHIFSRYMSASCIAFTFALTLRDIWILIVIDRMAAGIRDGRLP